MIDGEITNFLKTVFGAKLTNDGKSLIWSNTIDEWYVYYRPRYAKSDQCLYSGESIHDALQALEN
jgi:hypothetical protein